MKLRINGNSLRFRVSRSDLARLLETGVLEETLYFGREEGAELTYVLARDSSRRAIDVESSPKRVAVILPGEAVRAWSATEQVGISAEVDLGVRGSLSVLVEKDFACLDGSAEPNADTFTNPNAAHVC